MRETIAGGKAIAVIGWRASNHDSFTQELSPDRVIFTKNTELPRNVGYALLTRFLTHSEVAKVRRQTDVHAIPLETGEIKRLLQACGDLLAAPTQCESRVPSTSDSPTLPLIASPLDGHDQILDYITQPAEEQAPMEKFAKAFMAVAEKTGLATVSAITLAKLRKEHELSESSLQLVQQGWIIPEIPVGGQKASQYRAGEKLVTLARGTIVEPTDPIERARFMISQKDSILAERATIVARQASLVAELEAVDNKIKRINAAARLLDELAKI
jgi:hypothetical protein